MSNSNFWRDVSGARPGRVSTPKLRAQPLSKTTDSNSAHAQPQKLSTGGLNTSFQSFQDSVSDVWDVELEKDAGSNQGRGNGSSPAAAITPVHAQNSHQNGARKNENLHSLGPKYQAPYTAPLDPESEKERNRCAKFATLLDERTSNQPINLQELQSQSWSGIPSKYRSRVWKLLCGYLPPTPAKTQEVLQRKREEYSGYVDQYFDNKEEDIHRDTFRQIAIDVPRMSPLVGLFQQRCVQEMVERILYIWAIRHPASGYVQGINDLVTPFLMVFLQDFVDKDVTRNSFDFQVLEPSVRKNIEADSFWCMTRVLDGIQDNYTFAQPGIQVKIRQLEELLKRVDMNLHNHIVGHDVQYLQFSFRWMNNLLLRELPLSATIRLWDTYLSESDGFSKFHLYVCAAFLRRWKPELETKADFQSILLFIQNVPTAKWSDKDISLLVAEAYKLKYMFADAPSHLTECRINKPLL